MPDQPRLKILTHLFWNLSDRILRASFHLLYHQFAWTYDTVSWLVSLGDWRQWQMAALPEVRGLQVLELAHGPGHMLVALSKNGFQVTGIDLSPQMGRVARKRLIRSGEKVLVVRCPAQHLPFPQSSFDSVLTTFPTEFLMDPLTLRAVNRVLTTNGRFIIVPGSKLTGTRPIEKLIEWLFRITGQRGYIEDQQNVAVESQGNRWEAFTKIFHECGFSMKRKDISFERSEVTMLIAEKHNTGVRLPEQ
ncbi:MAG: methyltransferase domain-containing protein [Candidatus Promineifilaceae bacterium]|nr:methyltransferase domain-containing protein [Candidatus Promineifilaceae bacterium]